MATERLYLPRITQALDAQIAMYTQLADDEQQGAYAQLKYRYVVRHLDRFRKMSLEIDGHGQLREVLGWYLTSDVPDCKLAGMELLTILQPKTDARVCYLDPNKKEV